MSEYDNLTEPTPDEYYQYHEEEKPCPTLDPREFEFNLADTPFTLKLDILSQKTKEWHTYLTDGLSCNCPAGAHSRPCRHLRLVQDCGGYAAVTKACLDKLHAQPKGA
jgi:hypothetical protein